MEKLSNYTIEIARLQNKEYSFTWSDDASFFALFENSLIEKGTFEAKLLLRKSEALLHLEFFIKGEMELTCDRSLEPFDYPFETKGMQIWKFSDQADSIDDEMELIPRGTAEINVAHYIYELITLSIPMKKLHPRYQANEGPEDLILVYSSKTTEQTEENTPTDPRWEELKKLLDKKK